LTGTLSVLNPATNTITPALNYGTDTVPFGVAVDSANGDLSVFEETENLSSDPPTVTLALQEISPANAVTDTINLPAGTELSEFQLAVNPASGDVYLPTEGIETTSHGDLVVGQVLVIDPATNTVTTDVLGDDIEPSGLAVDPSGAEAGDIYVAEDDDGQGGLSVIPAGG
jgi:DNA-binding beta-propeller fold protein YncE